jgi:ribonuclease D
MILLLKNIQNRMIRELTKWKTENQSKFDDNDKISVLFNKAIIKLMNISFTQDATLSRIKNGLYNYLKTDLKDMIDYEFEF